MGNKYSKMVGYVTAAILMMLGLSMLYVIETTPGDAKQLTQKIEEYMPYYLLEITALIALPEIIYHIGIRKTKLGQKIIKQKIEFKQRKTSDKIPSIIAISIFGICLGALILISLGENILKEETNKEEMIQKLAITIVITGIAIPWIETKNTYTIYEKGLTKQPEIITWKEITNYTKQKNKITLELKQKTKIQLPDPDNKIEKIIQQHLTKKNNLL